MHEIVLQKGDRVPLPDRQTVRLVYDYVRCLGKRPEVFFTANLTPVAEGDQDAGPGARQKQKNGQWKLIDEHSADKFMRV